MNTEYTLLLAGSIYDNHMIRFVRNLKKVNPQSRLFFIGLKKENGRLDQVYLDCFESIFLFPNYRCRFRIPIIKSILTVLYWRKMYKSLLKNCHFDIINIHYPSCIYFFVLDLLKVFCRKIVLTPWGSDVYRISFPEKILLKKIYKASDYVTGGGDRFSSDFMKIFEIPENKFRYAHIGSEAIDYIVMNNKKITTEEAKEKLNIKGFYSITCGYNASNAQNHLDIIRSINKIRNKLPSPFILLFPMTYPTNSDYIEEVKQLTKEYNINSLFYEKYLDIEELFYLRKATDLFIHVQDTDANSTSLREYLLCDKKVINGSWLRYSDIETDDCIPYFLVNSLENLEDIILKASNSEPIDIPKNIKSVIEAMGCKKVAWNWNDIFTNIS